MRNALNLRFCFLVTFLLFIPLMYALPPEGITIKGRVFVVTLKLGVEKRMKHSKMAFPELM